MRASIGRPSPEAAKVGERASFMEFLHKELMQRATGGIRYHILVYIISHLLFFFYVIAAFADNPSSPFPLMSPDFTRHPRAASRMPRRNPIALLPFINVIGRSAAAATTSGGRC